MRSSPARGDERAVLWLEFGSAPFAAPRETSLRRTHGKAGGAEPGQRTRRLLKQAAECVSRAPKAKGVPCFSARPGGMLHKRMAKSSPTQRPADRGSESRALCATAQTQLKRAAPKKINGATRWASPSLALALAAPWACGAATAGARAIAPRRSEPAIAAAATASDAGRAFPSPFPVPGEFRPNALPADHGGRPCGGAAGGKKADAARGKGSAKRSSPARGEERAALWLEFIQRRSQLRASLAEPRARPEGATTPLASSGVRLASPRINIKALLSREAAGRRAGECRASSDPSPARAGRSAAATPSWPA